MSRNWLKPSSLFLIACRNNGQLYYLGNHSSITNALTLEKELKYSQIVHYLFQVQVNHEYEYSVPQRFYEALLIKHKYSNKYLNYAQEMGHDNHEGCQLALSHEKVRWTVLPCFKYQIKNTQNIEHAERIYITEQFYQNNGSKNLFVKEHLDEENGVSTYELIFGFHFKTQILLIKFHEDDGKSFHFGQCLKIYHQESNSFLVDSTPADKMLANDENQVQKWEVAFQNQHDKLGQSMLDCIWTLQDSISIKGATNINGTIIMETEVRLKNSITRHYLTLQDQSTDDQIFKFMGDKEESVYSVFKLETVKEEDKLITQNVQIRMKHSIIYQYIAVSQHRESHALIQIKMDKIAQDQHFFEFQHIPFHQELTVYFLTSLKIELHNIYVIISNEISKGSFEKIKRMQINIQTDLHAIQKIFTNNELLKEQLNFFIPMIVKNIIQLWQISKNATASKEIYQIIKLNNILLTIIAKDNLKNQIHVFKYIHVFLPCLFKQLYVEQLLIQILKNNTKLLSKLSEQNAVLQRNIIQAIVENIDIQLKKDKTYWKKMKKIIQLFQVMVKDYDKFIDINQRLIAIELFGQKMLFDRLFFSIKIKKSLFYIHHPTSNIEMPINNFKEPEIRQIIGKTLQFISSVCEDRNIISKKLVSNYLYFNQNEKNNQQDKRSRLEDLKTIINCFYIRNQGDLRSKIFLLQANLYVDSFPRLKRYRPVNVMRLDIESMKVTSAKDAASQMAELSSRLKQSIMLKAEKSYFSRPLTLFKSRTENSYQSITNNEEPTFTTNEISEYKKIVLLLLQTQIWTIQILKILRILLNLSILTPQQKITIYNKIFDKILTYSSNTLIIKELLMILQYLLKSLKQDKLQKIKHYFILMYFKEKRQVDTSDLKHIIQSGVLIKFNQKLQTPTNQLVSTRYNEISAHIHEYSKPINIIQSILEIFLKNEYDTQTMLNFMEFIKAISSPYYQTVSLLLNTSILGQQDLSQFNQLQSYSLEINNLTQISEEWLCNDEQNSPNYLRFSYLMDQITNFMYYDYFLDSQQGIKYRKKHKINKFRQITMKNIGMHEYLLNLLDINAYLLQGQTLRTLKKKIRMSLQKCFGFLYIFCFKCEQNKDTLFLQMGIINKYINLLEVGQTQLWIHLIKDKKKLIQQITIEDIQKIIFKIVKDRTSVSYQSCDYNPLYIDQLMTLVDINGKPFKPNIQKIAKVLQQPLILRKILYLVEDKKKRNQFCLQLYKLRIDPTQIPVIYQAKLIELLIYMIKELGNKNSHLRRAFRGLISLDYLFYLASLEDSFTQQGIPTDMNFVLKIEVLKMLPIYLSNKDIENMVYQCIQITKFLEYYKTAFSVKQIKKQSMVDNEMLYFSYIEKYEYVIQYYQRNSLLFYTNYLKPIFIRLQQIFDKLSNKEQDENYQLLSFLLDNEQLSQLKKQFFPKGLEKQIEIYMKWSNFMPMSSQPKLEENYTKNLLFQVLTNNQTTKYLNQQKNMLYIIIEKHEDQFLLRVKSILNKISQSFQEFHQKPLYKLMLLLYQYMQYKINKQKDSFSYQPPSLILSQMFEILIIPIIRLICLKQFDYNRVFCQKIFHFSLLIISTILSYKIKFKRHDQIFKFLRDQKQNGSGFLKCLRKAIIQMIDQEVIDSIQQQINFAQSSLSLISQQQRIEPILSTLLLIKELCRYIPFTKYFKGQNSDTIDFVELVYTSLMTILSQGAQTINIQKVKRIEYLCETLGFMFNGCDKINQSIVTNKQFIKQAESFLKIDLIQSQQVKNDNEDNIINEISQLYKQAIPEYKNLLQNQLKFFRFKHFYVINCVKTSLLKVLLASTISNEESIEKLKLHMSVELIKLNIIVLHERALKNSSKSKEKAYLERFQNWRDVYYHQQEYLMSFTLSTYGFALIKALQGELQSSQTGKQRKKVSQQFGEMQNFMPQSMKLLLKQLKDEPFFRDILLFYQKYFQAFKYFKDTFTNIEIAVDQSKTIVDVTFPRLPLCNQFDEDKMYELQYETNRLNQQETTKSFIILTQNFYKEIEGDLQFNQKLQKSFPFSKYLLIIFKRSDLFYPFFCIINLLLSLLHLLVNFQIYSGTSTFQSFQQQIFVLYDPLTTLRGILFIFQVANLTFCTFLMMFLVVKKIPFYFFLHLKAYHKLNPKQRVGISKYQFGYGIINLIDTVFLDIFLVTFAALTIIHPVFSTFVLLYLLTRLQLGRILLKMVRALYIQLLVVIGVLIVLNYCYAIFIYVNLTVGTSYGAECNDTFVCIKLFMDQIIKGGFVTLLPSNYVDDTINLQFFVEYSYNLLIPGVLIEIFRGLNIDKMSYFRQRVEAIEKNQKEKCYICGQKQFEIDLVLEGYQRHQHYTHNRLNYVAFIFYLRRKNREKYMFYEDLVSNCLAQIKYSWIPFETSMRKQKIMADQVDDEPFQVKFLASLQQKQTQARKILAYTKKTKRQIRKYLQISQDQMIRMSPQSPSSPNRSKFNQSKQFRSN